MGAVRRDYQSPVVCDRSSLFDQFRRSFRLRPDDFGRFDSQKGSFDLVSQGCEGREESNELLVPSSSVNIKIDSPKSVLRPRRTRDLTLNLSWHAWIARKEALEAYFDEIVRVGELLL